MAVEQGDAEFQSKLDEPSRKRARDELHELNDKDREMAVQSLRQWVLQQKWLRTPTDFEFLLRFLRARKFSQLLARETLEHFWTTRTMCTEWYRDVDPCDPDILEILKTGAIAVPKVYDKEGRRLIIETFSKVDKSILKKKGAADTYFKTMCLVLDWVNRDENVQVNGLLMLVDHTEINLSNMMTLCDPEKSKRMMMYFQNSLPVRMKGFHIYNQATFFDVIFGFFSPFMKQKMKDRMHLHGGSMVNVYKHIDQQVLPKDYLPDDCSNSVGTKDSVVDEMIADITSPEFRSYLKTLSSDRYGVDLKEKDKDAPVASFRKLNVD